MAETLTIVDLGMGNLRSVERALRRAADDAGRAVEVQVRADPEAIGASDRVVVPGQGAFADCGARLQAGVGEALRAHLGSGKPYLGICLGMQALFETSEEAPGVAGLGWFAGAVRRIPDGAVDPRTGEAVKVPHMGWNEVRLVRDHAGPLEVFRNRRAHLYFVHSYHVVPDDQALVAAIAEHGPHRITAAIQQGAITATQFHPEKSQSEGLRLLEAFLKS
ncbi:MAG: imidazole glycerol phosphate synthase subunit HisH [Polyangiaceae bacterium]